MCSSPLAAPHLNFSATYGRCVEFRNFSSRFTFSDHANFGDFTSLMMFWTSETKEDKHEKEIDALILAKNILMVRMIISADEIFFTAQITINQVSLYVYLASKVEIFFCLSNRSVFSLWIWNKSKNETITEPKIVEKLVSRSVNLSNSTPASQETSLASVSQSGEHLSVILSFSQSVSQAVSQSVSQPIR